MKKSVKAYNIYGLCYYRGFGHKPKRSVNISLSDNIVFSRSEFLHFEMYYFNYLNLLQLQNGDSLVLVLQSLRQSFPKPYISLQISLELCVTTTYRRSHTCKGKFKMVAYS